MSTATSFDADGPFPFCVENMTMADISALGFAFITGSLNQIMERFWNIEKVNLNFSSHGIDANGTSYFCVGDEYSNWFTATSSTPPNSRVCRSEVTPDDFESASFGPIGAITSDMINNGIYEGYVRFVFRRVVYDTTNSRYMLLLSAEMTPDDAAFPVLTTDRFNSHCTLNATFSSSIFGLTSTMWASDAVSQLFAISVSENTRFTY